MLSFFARSGRASSLTAVIYQDVINHMLMTIYKQGSRGVIQSGGAMVEHPIHEASRGPEGDDLRKTMKISTSIRNFLRCGHRIPANAVS